MPRNRAPKKKIDFDQELLFLFSSVAAITLLLLSSLNLKTYLFDQKVLGSSVSQTSTQKQKEFWHAFLAQNPAYFEGWNELGQIYLKEGNLSEAKKSFAKAREINPNLD